MPTAPKIDRAAPLVRAYVARVEDVNPKKRTIVGKINTAALDHYRTVIEPKGIELGAYRQNPVVLHEHGMDALRGSLPVARNNWIRSGSGPSGPELLAETEFVRRDDFADTIFECYREGLMRGLSVRVVPNPRGYGPPTPEEIRRRPELADAWCIYRSTTLAEYSTVAVPGNPECLTVTAEQGRSILALVARGLSLPAPLIARAESAVAAEQEEEEAEEDEDEGRSECEEKGKKRTKKKRSTEDDVPDDEHEEEDDDERARSLPPLGGRPLAEARAEQVAALKRMLDPAAFAAEVRMHADFRKGVV